MQCCHKYFPNSNSSKCVSVSYSNSILGVSTYSVREAWPRTTKVVSNARFACSRHTWKLTPIFLINESKNQWINESINEQSVSGTAHPPFKKLFSSLHIVSILLPFIFLVLKMMFERFETINFFHVWYWNTFVVTLVRNLGWHPGKVEKYF